MGQTEIVLKDRLERCFEHLEIRIWDLFRISDFEFRISYVCLNITS